MIDWRIAKIASSGMRGIRLRLRHATTRPSLNARRTLPIGAGAAGVELGGGHAIFSSGVVSASASADSSAA